MGERLIGNRIMVAIALMLIVPAIVLIFAYSFGGNKDMGEAAQQKNMESYTEKLNQRNADIIFYDKDPIGPVNLKARRVNALNDQGLALNLFSDKAFHVIILDDMDGTLSLTDQDIQKLKDLLMNHHFRIIYLGTAHYYKLVQGGLLSQGMNHKEGTKSYLTFYSKTNMQTSVEGTAFADDPAVMPIKSGLTEEETLIYTVIVELGRKDLYWT